MIRTVRLNAIETALAGQYTPGDRVLVLCDASLAAFTVTLPDAGSVDDIEITLVKSDTGANAVTVATVENQTISGNTTQTLANVGDAMSLLSDGGNWWIG